LFGVFLVRPGVDYGEKRQNTLGRLLQAIIAQSGDITALNWVGRPSKFTSCLPAEISSYKAPPSTYPYVSTEEMYVHISLVATRCWDCTISLEIVQRT
jgi:hypothetical protein